MTWTGDEWVSGDLAWQSGAWVPTDEPPSEVVNNETRLERLRPIDRALLICALFAALACLAALVFQVVRVQWELTGLDADNFGRGVRACLVAGALFVVAFVALAVARLMLLARRK